MRIAVIAFLFLASCGDRTPSEYTLYRSSPLSKGMRIHFATFNAREQTTAYRNASFNLENCRMTAELLNANVAKLNNGKQPARFWCERGPFRAS